MSRLMVRKTLSDMATKRIRVHSELNVAPIELRAVLNAVPAAIFLIDSNRRILIANEASSTIFKIKVSQIEGKFLQEWNDQAFNIPGLTSIVETVLTRDSTPRDLVVSQNFPGVGHRDLSLHAEAIRNGSGTVAILTIEDRPSKQTAVQLDTQKTSLLRDEFLSTLSHELRTPLTTILGWAQTLRLGKSDPEKTDRAIAVIEKSARDQGQLIDDLLDVSRIKSGKMLLKLREINPNECIITALESVRSAAEHKSIEIQTYIDPSNCVINADAGRMEQVFRNLFTNAVKFTPSGGKITVRTKLRKARKHIDIQVEDTGKGIPAEFLPHLFARFSQEDSSTRRMFSGLGLGLSIVRNLVQMHKGDVTANSPGEGKGSVFTVTLPCVVRISEGSRNRIKRPVSLAGLRVLVIDDLEAARDTFSAMLQSSRAQVETAASARAGLTALGRFKPDLALCDIAMPEEDGLSFIRRVRSLEPGKGGKTPAIAVTAFADTTDVHKALAAGFDAHLAKPVDAVELSRLIVKLARRDGNRH